MAPFAAAGSACARSRPRRTGACAWPSPPGAPCGRLTRPPETLCGRPRRPLASSRRWRTPTAWSSTARAPPWRSAVRRAAPASTATRRAAPFMGRPAWRTDASTPGPRMAGCMHSVWRGIAKPFHEARVAVAAHLLALGLLLLLCGLRAPGRLVGAASWTISEPSTGITVRVDPRGSYTIASRIPRASPMAWTFGGSLGRPLTHMALATGPDGTGRYREVAFHYHVDAARIGRIRLYHGKPVVLFSVTYLARARNTAPFPALTTYPHTPYHMSFGGPFGIYRFDLGGRDSPWLLFDARANTFILSPASDFMVAATTSLKAGADLARPSLARPSGRVAIA